MMMLIETIDGGCFFVDVDVDMEILR